MYFYIVPLWLIVNLSNVHRRRYGPSASRVYIWSTARSGGPARTAPNSQAEIGANSSANQRRRRFLRKRRNARGRTLLAESQHFYLNIFL